MRNAYPLLLLMLCACQPKGDEARSREATAEGGALGSAGRSSGDPVAKGAENVVLPPIEDMVQPAPANTAEPSNVAQPAPAVTDLAIPPRYHGRWGLVPADCTSTRGDAKGLITVDGRTIRFYESVGTLAEVRPAIATSFSGLFRFSGEGMNWTRVETLTLNGTSLQRRTEPTTDQSESPASLTYSRCPA